MTKIFLIIPLAIGLGLLSGGIVYHDMSVEAGQFVDNWDCDRLDYWLEWEGKKIVNNLFTPVVQEMYEVKCL